MREKSLNGINADGGGVGGSMERRVYEREVRVNFCTEDSAAAAVAYTAAPAAPGHVGNKKSNYRVLGGRLTTLAYLEKCN